MKVRNRLKSFLFNHKINKFYAMYFDDGKIVSEREQPGQLNFSYDKNNLLGERYI